MTQERKRHPRHADVQFLRDLHPYQVEVVDWLVRTVSRPGLVERFHTLYRSPASWCDHVGARTFGFATEQDAMEFAEQQNAVPLFTPQETTA